MTTTPGVTPDITPDAIPDGTPDTAPSITPTLPRAIARRIWRFPLTQMLVEAVLVSAVAMFGSQGIIAIVHRFNPHTNSPAHFLGALVLAAVIVLAWKAIMRWIERAPDPCYTLAGAPAELGLGVLAGFVIFSAMVLATMALGGFAITGVRGVGVIWDMLSLGVVSATFEELLFRGVIFRQIEAMLGTWWALAITSALFGAAHLVNPDASWVAAVAIMIEAGVLLGAAYLYTRRLWLAMGIHGAWNFTQGWVFSVPVSGGPAPLGLLVTRRIGSPLLTGGAFGLEASLVAMAVAGAAGFALLALAVRRHGTRPPMWGRSVNTSA